MDHYMPEIFWHDRQALLSVDVFPRLVNDKYRIATSSVQKEIRLWYLHFEQVSMPVLPLAVDFVANLAFHNSAVNQIKFSPTSDVALLASADCDGRVVIWQLNSDSAPPPATEDLPPNKENWVRLKVLNHDSDVSSICWSPDGKYLASVSNDDCLLVHEALTGKRSVSVRNFRHFPNGVSWDPLSKYLVTMSADRKMDLIDAAKGTKLRCFGHTTLPSARVIQPEAQLEEKQYRLFHDDQLFSFQRGVSFSPCGQFIAAPCAHIESGPADIYGTFIFKREHLNKETPFALLPSPKPTFLVRFCPLVMELLDGDANLLGLPYRVLFLALTKDSILFYDSQHAHPIGSVENIHYNALTDAAWSTDGRIVVVSSLEGYCSFLRLNLDKWGQQYTGSLEAVAPLSPQLIQTKKKKTKKEKGTFSWIILSFYWVTFHYDSLKDINL
ncbi:hypothetical protein WR25_20186 [Diploscapter pachys]|uniref:CAF1B/HIR1 beta-propeller domain-containing protein n=1 Tax=Diploscapter pachys TaxID=2018661 RepID=A0A2A2KZP5_9BILA|nr:hypothetical protein WR25_20186 [Diploscapter pachys]